MPLKMRPTGLGAGIFGKAGMPVKAGRGRIGWRDRRFLLPKSEAFDQLSG
jgi:hypothetical protein